MEFNEVVERGSCRSKLQWRPTKFSTQNQLLNVMELDNEIIVELSSVEIVINEKLFNEIVVEFPSVELDEIGVEINEIVD